MGKNLKTNYIINIVAMITAIIIGLVIVSYPKEFTLYLALSIALVFDALPLYTISLFFWESKDNPKMISKFLIWWLLGVRYYCFIAVGFLTNAYILSASSVVLVFDCIFAAFGLAAFVG